MPLSNMRKLLSWTKSWVSLQKINIIRLLEDAAEIFLQRSNRLLGQIIFQITARCLGDTNTKTLAAHAFLIIF